MPQGNYEKSKQYLASQMAAIEDSDHESKAILLHSLCVAGASDFSLANRLYRERPALSMHALLHLALAFVEMSHGPDQPSRGVYVDWRDGIGRL